jgi:hypothetical protein
MINNLRYPTKQQSMIWLMRRNDVASSAIADELNVQRPFVSKSLKTANERIRKLLEHAAAINRVVIHHMSEKDGFAVGYCAAYKSETYITFSPKLGIQIWFQHKGDCDSCAEYSTCGNMLTVLSKEWGIPLSRNASPTQVADDLFSKIMKSLDWRD